MSFADDAVQKLITKNFRCAWVNLKGDPDAGKSNCHDCKDMGIPLMRGLGKSNVQMLMLTPDGRILHAASGYVGPSDLAWEIEQALVTWRGAKKLPKGAEKWVADRQAAIHKAWKKRPKTGMDKLIGDRLKGRDTQDIMLKSLFNTAEVDHEFVRKHPLLPVGTFRTRMLTGGNGGFFGYQTGGGDAKKLKELLAKLRKKD